MQSVSEYAVSACGQKLVGCDKLAPATDLTTGSLNVTMVDVDYLPFVDGLALDSAVDVAQAFAFTASTDPGEAPRLGCLHCWPQRPARADSASAGRLGLLKRLLLSGPGCGCGRHCQHSFS